MPQLHGRHWRKLPTTILIAVFPTEQVEAVVERELLPAPWATASCTSWCFVPAPAIPIGWRCLGEQRRAARGLRVSGDADLGLQRPGPRAAKEWVLIGGGRDRFVAVQPTICARCSPLISTSARPATADCAKLAVNLILGLNRLALAEGLVFAERLGLDPAAFLDVARRSAAYSQVMDVKGSKMLRRDFAPEGRITQHLKDVHLMLEQAAGVRQQLPLLAVHAEVLKACVRHEEGELDNSIVIEEIWRRSAERV